MADSQRMRDCPCADWLMESRTEVRRRVRRHQARGSPHTRADEKFGQFH